MESLTDAEIRTILKNNGEDIGPIIPSTRNIYVRKIQNLQQNKIQPSKQIRKSELIFNSEFNSSIPKNDLQIDVDKNYRKQSKPDTMTQTRPFGNLVDSHQNTENKTTYKRTEPVFINKVDRSDDSEFNSTMDSDLEIIADDNYRKELKGKNVSPITYSNTHKYDYYRPSDHRSTHFIFGNSVDSHQDTENKTTCKRTEPVFINKVDRKPSRNSEFNSTMDSDLQIIADDNYRKELKGKNVSPITYSNTHKYDYYRPSDHISTHFINNYSSETNIPQVNTNNNKKWYNGSLHTISNYFVNRKKREDLMDISDGDMSDNESNLMTRLRKNYFKKTGSSNVDKSKLKSKTEKKTDSSFVNLNQLPNFLLIAFIIFAVVLFSSYLMMKNRYLHIELGTAIDNLICKDNSRDCFTAAEMPQLKQYLNKLYEILSEYSGEKTCEFIANKRIPFSKARDILNRELKRNKQDPISEINWSRLMRLMIVLPRDKLEIVGYNNNNEIVEIDGLPEHITYLEGLKPRLSLICKLKMAFLKMLNWILYIAFLLVVIILVLILGYGLNVYRLKRKVIKERHTNELKEIVSSISVLLQDQLRQSEYSHTTNKFLPLTKIRSILQQSYPQLRNNQFWEELKRFMYKSEPLIEIKETIAQGEILEWKSHLGWQGSAVQSDCEVKFEKGPTECLKIRNMDLLNFDESGRNYLRREVINRINDAGEVNDIKFLTKGQNVIVYVMCASREVAGRAFRKINANYFNGNLLNVKFIRLDKYLERFPESKIYVK